MSRRDYSQKTFSDTLIEGRIRRRKRLEKLERIDGLLDWDRIDGLLDGINAGTRGARGYPPLSMLKGLLLAQWHDLSDPGLEDALADRLSFRRFCGFPLDEETPDETSFVRFRARLRDLGLYEKLFAEVNRQLEARGLMVKTGTLVDATVIEARAKPPRSKEGEVSAVDPDAGFTKKHGRTYFGYKLHIGVDAGSELIRALETSSADLHDGEAFGALITGDEAKVYGDKAYGSAKNRNFLDRLGIGDRLMFKAARNTPLKSWQEWFNKAVSAVRSGVERIFGTGKTCYGLGRTRYFGEARVAGDCHTFAIAYNLRRALSLV
ncbi:MAG: IS5 family transposase [Pseudomonadota bacterium]